VKAVFVVLGTLVAIGLVIAVITALTTAPDIADRLNAEARTKREARAAERAGVEHGIMRAIDQGKVDDLAEYLSHGGDPNARAGIMGETLLLRAVQYHGSAERIALTKLLLDAKADPNATNDAENYVHNPPLMVCDSDVVDLLVAAGADSKYRGFDGHTPLHAIAEKEHAGDAIALLVKNGADPNATGTDLISLKTGTTALHVAAAHGRLENVRALVSAGAIVNGKNAEGRTPKDLAAEKLHWAVVDWLGKLSAVPSSAAPSGK
jgi:ankyrin repeat protein